MRPGEILDAQADLLWRLRNNEMFREYQALASTATIGGGAQAILERRHKYEGLAEAGDGDAWVEAMEHYLQAAYAYRVTPDMGVMLDHAASALDESDSFNRDLAPTGCGIVRFEKPIEIVDSRGKLMLIHWAVWGPATVRGKPGLAVTFFNDAWKQPDQVYEDYLDWRAHNTKLGVAGVNPTKEDKELQETYEIAMRSIGRWASAHQIAVCTGDELGPSQVEPGVTQQAQIIAEGGTPQAAGNLVRHMHALFLLLNQTIVETEVETPERHARKRAVKAKIPPQVTVIRLRRSKTDNRQEGESLVEWSHRWLVRQHWRWQPYGTRKDAGHRHQYGETHVEGGSLLRQCTHEGCTNYVSRIMIPAAVKGPADKPLIVSDKLYQLEK